MANQDQTYKGQIYTQTAEPIRYPTHYSKTSCINPADHHRFQLLQQAWNKLSIAVND